MHKWYDPRRFDLRSREEIMEVLSVPPERQEPLVAAKTGEELLLAGVDVRSFGSELDAELGAADGLGDADMQMLVEDEVFCRWVETAGFALGSVVSKWWLRHPSDAAGGDAALKQAEAETPYDLFRRLVEQMQDKSATVANLVKVLVRAGAFDNEKGAAKEEDFPERVLAELVCASHMFGDGGSSGVLESGRTALMDDEDAQRSAQQLAFGWPSRSDEPTGARALGRLPKSFPLKFPMGIGGLDDERPRAVSPQEHAQHLLRMEWTWGPHGDRLVWALVNGLLVRQASGKGFLVHRIMMRRLGWRVAGQEVLTKGELRNLMSDESTARSLVGQLGTCGRDVPSTPMHWSFEGKKLDAAVKHLSWCPPWVRSDSTKEVPPGFIPEEHRVDDVIGLGRIPTAWWTLNCKYNDAYDIHRFNVRVALRRQVLCA